MRFPFAAPCSRRAGIALLAIAACLQAAPSAPAQGPTNRDFEQGDLGKTPAGWFVPKPCLDEGYLADLSDEQPHSGKRCVVLSRKAGATGGPFGNLLQRFDAAPFRGQRVLFKAAVRVEGAGTRAQLWLRADRKNGLTGAFDNMDDRPITAKEWREYEIYGDIDEDVTSISVGLMFFGNGRAWLDTVSFEPIGKAGAGAEPARPLAGRALDNLVAFTRLLGYVRYFHPSDEASAVNWDAFAADGMAAVEKAANPAELADALGRLFQPIAPTVRVFATGQPPEPAPAVPKEAIVKTLAWRHFGVGLGPKSIYASERIDLAAPKPLMAGKLSELKYPKAGQPFSADLGGGVSCLVPLALAADSQGTLPRAEPGKAPASAAKPKGFRPSGKDRTTRLAAVALAWNVFQHFYPYFDVVETDWAGELRRALAAAATDRDEQAFLDTLRRLVAALKDGHGTVSFNVEAIFSPPLLWDWVEDRLVVVRAAAPADALRPGAVIVKIDGRPTAEALAQTEQLVSGATPQWRRWVALRLLLRGVKDSELVLEVEAAPGKTQTTHLIRTLPPPAYAKLDESRPEKVAELKPGIFYVDLDRITDADFTAAVPKLEKAKGIVFDLRGYPRCGIAPIGHLIDKPVTCAQWHIPVTAYPDRQHVAFSFSNWSVPPRAPRFQAKVAFLTDGRAISYAETYLGIIEHYKLAAIVGSPTAGTNGNINPFTLPGGYTVYWTGMKVLKHNAARHHGVGIQPTVRATRTLRGVAEGRDEVLERGIEAVADQR